MKIVALSDLHGNLPPVPPCDLLLLAGDLTPVEDHSLSFQAHWLNTAFRAWLAGLPARHIVGVAGNHDFIFERAPYLVPRDLPWTYLEDEGEEWEGVRIYGTPWQPPFYDWAFNLPPEELRRKWARIPDDTDVLVLHGPPFGYGDGVPLRHGGLRRAGCPDLRERLEAVRPRLAVFGHIHPGAGIYVCQGTVLANVSLLDDAYRVVNGPSVFRLDVAERRTVVCAAPGLPADASQEVLWGD
jgi:Icc-related predicted phosphoesterase